MLATALTTGALLALPGAAFAAPDVTVSLDAPADVVAGSTQTYVATVSSSGDAMTAEEGDVTFSVTEGSSTITSLVADTAGAASMNTAGDVVCTVGTATCHLLDGFTNGQSFTITVTLQTPKFVESGNELTAQATSDDEGAEPWNSLDTDLFNVLANGGPSALYSTFGDSTPSAGLLNEWVALNGTVSTTVVVKNQGSGAANFVVFQPNAWGYASLLSPEPPAFNPTATVTGEGCAPLSGGRCELPTLAAGASITLTITTSGLTHLGSVETGLSVDSKADSGFDQVWDSTSIQIANGEVNDVHAAFGDVVHAGGNTPVTFTGEFSNVGPNAITNGILEVGATSFKSNGDVWGGGADQIQSIQSITLSNGVACANKVESGVPVKDEFHCPLASVAAGTRVTMSIVAIFPSAKLNQNPGVWFQVHTAGWNPPTSDVTASDYLQLNPEKYQDLEVSLGSTGVIGADRLNPITINVKNGGNTKAENVSLDGELRGVGGEFDKATLPPSCTGVSKPMYSDCSLGNIEPGATATIVLNVRAGTNLGDLVAIFEAQGGGLLDLNADNNTLIQVLEVKKAADVPFLGVKIAKSPMRNIAQLAKIGVPATVTCPSACKVVGQLQVTRMNAEKLGLVKKPRKRNPKASPLITIGTGTKTDADGGKVVVSIKLTKAYKLKVAKLTKPLTVSRVLTVSSTDTATKDASFKKAQAVTFKPVKKPRKPRR